MYSGNSARKKIKKTTKLVKAILIDIVMRSNRLQQMMPEKRTMHGG